MNDKATVTPSAPAESAPASNDSTTNWQEKYNHTLDQLRNWMSKATHYEKTWGTLGDFEQVKTSLDSHNKRGKDAPSDNQDSGKKTRETEALQAQLAELSKKYEGAQALNKQLRVVGEAMKHHGSHFVPKSEAEIQNIVMRACDFDEKANMIIIKDEKGDVRYSTERPGNVMNVEELFNEIKRDRPYLAKASVNGGTMNDGQPAWSGPGESFAAGGIPAHLMTNQAALTKYLKNNPAVLTQLLNNGI